MNGTMNTQLGEILVNTDVIAKYAGSSAVECFGVVGMVAGSSKQKLFNLFSKEDTVDTGICVTGNTDSINVEVHIVVTYGMNINAIAESITEKVRYVVGEATGITVDKVIVKVDGIKE